MRSVSRPARGAWIETATWITNGSRGPGRAPRGARGLKRGPDSSPTTGQ